MHANMQEIASLAEVPATGTALLAVGTSWCTFCAKTYGAIDEVMPRHPDVQLVHIDGDEEPDVLQDPQVDAKTYPQLLLFRDGVKVAQRESADGETLAAWLGENGVA